MTYRKILTSLVLAAIPAAVYAEKKAVPDSTRNLEEVVVTA